MRAVAVRIAQIDRIVFGHGLVKRVNRKRQGGLRFGSQPAVERNLSGEDPARFVLAGYRHGNAVALRGSVRRSGYGIGMKRLAGEFAAADPQQERFRGIGFELELSGSQVKGIVSGQNRIRKGLDLDRLHCPAGPFRGRDRQVEVAEHLLQCHCQRRLRRFGGRHSSVGQAEPVHMRRGGAVLHLRSTQRPGNEGRGVRFAIGCIEIEEVLLRLLPRHPCIKQPLGLTGRNGSRSQWGIHRPGLFTVETDPAFVCPERRVVVAPGRYATEGDRLLGRLRIIGHPAVVVAAGDRSTKRTAACHRTEEMVSHDIRF